MSHLRITLWHIFYFIMIVVWKIFYQNSQNLSILQFSYLSAKLILAHILSTMFPKLPSIKILNTSKTSGLL